MVLETNPGSFVSLKSENGWFTRFYITYDACVDGFLVSWRPLIFLDGTLLKDRYKDTFLTATAYDGDNRLFSLAFYMCDIENKDN